MVGDADALRELAELRSPELLKQFGLADGMICSNKSLSALMLESNRNSSSA